MGDEEQGVLIDERADERALPTMLLTDQAVVLSHGTEPPRPHRASEQRAIPIASRCIEVRRCDGAGWQYRAVAQITRRAALDVTLGPYTAAGLVFFASAGVLVVEIVALRLLAPYFGLTLETSTMVIAIALGAIATGSWTGGRLADRVPPLSLSFCNGTPQMNELGWHRQSELKLPGRRGPGTLDKPS